MSFVSDIGAGLQRFFSRAPAGSATLALRGEVVGLDRPDERRIISAAAPRWSARTRDEARNAEVSAVDSILRETADGRTSRFVDLCGSARDRDSRLDAVCRTRILAQQGRPFVFKAPPGYQGDKEAEATALWVAQKFHETRNVANLFGDLAHGVLQHAGLLEHQWYFHDNEWRTQPRFVHANRLGWDVESGEVGFYPGGLFGSGPLTPLSRYPGKFVLHTPVGGRSAYPWQRGALRSRLIGSITKRLGYRWWLKMLERWGQPQVFVTRPPSDSSIGPDGSDEDADIIAGLRKISEDWRAVIPNGAEISTIAADVKPDLHERFVAMQNLEDAVAILGQNLSTEVVGGSFAAAKAHQLVRVDILLADLAELTETITDQWVRPLVEFNRPGSPVPYIDWILGSKAEITVEAFKSGLYSADEVRASMGHDPEANGRGARYFDLSDGTATAAPATPIADVLRLVEAARGAGLQPSKASLSALLASAGLAMEAIPDGAPQPKPLPLAPTDIAKVVLVKEARASAGLPPFGDERDDLTISELDARIAAEAEKAKAAAMVAADAATAAPAAPTDAAPVATLAEPSPPASTPIEPDAVWIDSRDGHRIKVNSVEGTTVYAEDLDAPNAAGLTPQFAWSVGTFREWCKPPK